MPSHSHTRHTVLVVDDDDKIRELLDQLLSRDGFDVSAAQNAGQALQLLEERLPCMLLVDVMMPGMDGFELCRRLKADPRTANVPVALVTARTKEEDVQEGIAAGAVDYIKKPFDRDELRMRVRTQIRLHEAIVEQQNLHKHLNAISGATNDAIVIIDNNGNISLWNSAAETMFGFSRDEILGKSLHKSIVPERYHSAHAAAFSRFQVTGEGAAVGKTLELVAIRKSGEEFPVEVSLATTSIDGKWCAVGTIRDISSRKKTEDALRQSEQAYRLLYQESRDALMTLGLPSWKFQSCNQATVRMFAANTEAEFTKLGPWDVSPERQPDGCPSAEAAQAMIGKAIQEGSSSFPWVHRRLNGEEFPCEVLLTRIDHSGQLFLQATVRDTTERVRAAAALQASETRYRATFSDASVGLALVDATGHFLEVNPAFAKMLGYGIHELIGKSFSELTHPDDVATSIGGQRILLGGQQRIRMEKRYLRKDGTDIWVDVNVAALRDSAGTVSQFVTHVVDISGRKRMEEKLRADEVILRKAEQAAQEGRTFLNTLLNAIPVPIFYKDTRGCYRGINQAFVDFSGTTEADIIGKTVFDVFPRAMAEVYQNKDQELFSRQGTQVYETKSRDRFGVTRDVIYHKATFNDSDGHLRGLIGAILDVTERKLAEEAAKASSEFLNTILNTIPMPIFYKDAEGHFIGINKAYETFFDKTLEEVLGKTVFDIFPPKEAEFIHRQDLELLQQPGVRLYTEQFVDRRGALRDVLAHKATFADPDGHVRGILGALIDITDRKRVEAELGHSRKLEAVGQLAAGIAHEINTPAQYVGDGVYFLREVFESYDQLMTKYRCAIEEMERSGVGIELVKEIRDLEAEVDLDYAVANVPSSFDRCVDGISRISTIVRAMKEFSHPDQREKSPADLNQALQSTLIIARNEYKYVANLETELGDLPPVLCHLGDLNQVFLNLMVNAAHAIGDVVGKEGDKGQLRISTRHVGDFVEIDIADSGSGIPEAIRDRIFEPFFTTKEVGKGSGQGLAIARSIIVDKHNGSLTFKSEVGKGTTFTIRLPLDGNGSGRKEGSP